MGLRQPIASVMLRSGGHYRAIAFQRGLASCGYDVRTALPPAIMERDVIVVWNRYSHWHTMAQRFEDAGARVIVAENGYLGRHGVALALNHHNGAGSWHVGDESRIRKWKIQLKPWRERGEHVLVLPQRGVGPPGVAMPRGWLAGAMHRLRKATARPLRVREHPGLQNTPLEPDLANAWACVTWGSGAAVKAMVAGIPAFHELPTWIGAPAARCGIDDIEHPSLGDRTPMLQAVSWAQWTVEEIDSGEPFRRLLGCT